MLKELRRPIKHNAEATAAWERHESILRKRFAREAQVTGRLDWEALFNGEQPEEENEPAAPPPLPAEG